jgi:hypothetical protein
VHAGAASGASGASLAALPADGGRPTATASNMVRFRGAESVAFAAVADCAHVGSIAPARNATAGYSRSAQRPAIGMVGSSETRKWLRVSWASFMLPQVWKRGSAYLTPQRIPQKRLDTSTSSSVPS